MTQDLTPEAVAKMLRENCSCNIDTAPCGAEDECRNAFIAADMLEAFAAERDEWKSLAEAAIKDDATKNIHYAEVQHRADAAETKLAEVEASERQLSDAYLRIRTMLGAFGTNYGGENRFLVTEKALADLLAHREAAETKLTHMTIAWGKDALRVEELEAEVARLRDALRDAVHAWDNHNKSGDMMQGYWVDDARTALAAWEAGK
jgi:hypothetical protein